MFLLQIYEVQSTDLFQIYPSVIAMMMYFFRLYNVPSLTKKGESAQLHYQVTFHTILPQLARLGMEGSYKISTFRNDITILSVFF